VARRRKSSKNFGRMSRTGPDDGKNVVRGASRCAIYHGPICFALVHSAHVGHRKCRCIIEENSPMLLARHCAGGDLDGHYRAAFNEAECLTQTALIDEEPSVWLMFQPNHLLGARQ